MIILALDPGKTTGWCEGRLKSGVWAIEPSEDTFTLEGLYQFLQRFIDTDGSHIIYEDFQYRNRAREGLDLTPVKMLGIIELFRERYEPTVGFTKQSPATGKAFYSDEKLKALGVYKKGFKHGRDATRHLLQWANFGAGGRYLDVNAVRMVMV